MMQNIPPSSLPRREPLFNLPATMLFLVGGMLGLHLWLEYGMPILERSEFFWRFGFVPLFFQAIFQQPDFQYINDYPFLSVFFSLLSYSFLHGDWVHLGFNLIWLVIFGTPLLRHIGAWRFLLFWGVMAVASALAHFVFYNSSPIPMIGASGVVSGLMGAAVRYDFYRDLGGKNFTYALLPIGQALINKSALMLVGVWLLVNFAVGIGLDVPGAEDKNIAWQAHIGGLVAGLLLIGLFDKKEK